MTEEYEQVAKLLDNCGVESPPAEVHGMVCGLVCSGPPRGRDWAELGRQLLDLQPPLPDAVRELITRYAARIDEQMLAGDFTFQPLLPDDSAGLGPRIRGLALWCGGFSMGFGAGFEPASGKLPAETREVIEDFGRIARVETVSDAGLQDQDEADFTEILEYVRMASASLYLHNVPARQGDVPDDGQLH